MAERSRRAAAVIGAGFGGLSVAIRLQAAGISTTLFEARDQPGGCAAVYREQGFTFDAGPTVITAPGCLEELFALAGARLSDEVELLPVRPFYRMLWPDGDRLDYAGEAEAMAAEVRRISPQDERGYREFVDYAQKVFEAGYVRLASTPFLRFTDMVKVAPELGLLRADRSVYATVSRFVRNEHLRQALSFHTLLVGGSPYETSAIYTLIHFLERKWGVFFPRGGTGALVSALVRLFLGLGGELRLSSPVRQLQFARGGRPSAWVTTSARGIERFDLAVTNADLHHSYAGLLQSDDRASRMARQLKSMDWSMSLFVLYFGLDRTYENLAQHTVLFGPRYEGLLAEIFHGRSLPRDHSLYLHAPGVTDSSLAPAGCGAYYALAPVPHLGHLPLNWREAGPLYAERIFQTLEKVMPGLRRHLVVQRWRTPEHFRDELGMYRGSAFSCAPRLIQSAYFRPHNRDPRIPNLYLVGAGTHPGAGLPGVINGAKATARVILEDFSP